MISPDLHAASDEERIRKRLARLASARIPEGFPAPQTDEDRYVYSDPGFIAAQRKSWAAMDRRRAYEPGTSRARSTTANANWARAAEQRDRVEQALREEFRRFVAAPAVLAPVARVPEVPPAPRPVPSALSPGFPVSSVPAGPFTKANPAPRIGLAGDPALLGAKVPIGRTVYTVEPKASSTIPYVLVGPRGGTLDAIRNVNTGILYLMQGSRTLSGYAIDAAGAFVYRP